MKITSAEFIRSAFDRSHWLDDGRPEIAFLGRSNVGKSSLINSLLLRKALARTSNTPGRTQSINFFLINDRFYFADLPGYGYARVSKTTRQDWGKMAGDYLTDREPLALCVQIVDARHPPSKLDEQLNEWLVHHNKPHIVVATKTDKLPRTKVQRSLSVIERTFPDSDILPYSSETAAGRDELWSLIFGAVGKPDENFQYMG